MLHKTRGVVFKYFKYRDTSIIVKIFTEAFGLQTYVVNGVRSSKSKGRIALYQPLTLLDLVVYHKPSSDINRISEIKCSSPLKTIPYDIVKSSLGVFMAELLYKSIKEEGEVADLYEFVHHSIEILDHMEENYLNFHLQFLLKLTKYLGFGITSSDQFFLLLSDDHLSEITHLLLNESFTSEVGIKNSERRMLLEHLIAFYKVHIDNMGEVKSIKILREVLEDIQ
ncbi:DNA repair protein RecO [Fulvivirga lutimaris]|uniref:DNA repair protein RecO n=1 Tax=Fulvivirga lutimaris TaxID=1819566 RepID=UPI0012BC9556|nr:DNA repair protein RecO [Fulvivirga lutimaris]MTI41512.1 DNA repair protein RecO [Fulvivirga lutimaris]